MPGDLDLEDTPAMRAVATLVGAVEALFALSEEDLDMVIETFGEDSPVGGSATSDLRELAQGVKDERAFHARGTRPAVRALSKAEVST